MLEALVSSGWKKYSLFPDDGLLVGYFETDDFAAAQTAMVATEVNARWQAQMAPFFAELEGRLDEGMRIVPLVFQLETQLAAHRVTTGRKTIT